MRNKPAFTSFPYKMVGSEGLEPSKVLRPMRLQRTAIATMRTTQNKMAEVEGVDPSRLLRTRQFSKLFPKPLRLTSLNVIYNGGQGRIRTYEDLCQAALSATIFDHLNTCLYIIKWWRIWNSNP